MVDLCEQLNAFVLASKYQRHSKNQLSTMPDQTWKLSKKYESHEQPRRHRNGHQNHGVRLTMALAVRDGHVAFVTRQRTVEPTPIGLIPPPFLIRAHSEAPNKVGWTCDGTQPNKHILAKFFGDAMSLFPSTPVNNPIMSFRYWSWGLKPSRQPADPAVNDFIATAMSVSELALVLLQATSMTGYCSITRRALGIMDLERHRLFVEWCHHVIADCLSHRFT
jgi:hypothetical protein